MKFVKGFITFVLGIMFFILVAAFGVLTVGRTFLSGNNIASITKEVVKESGEVNIGQFIDKNAKVSTNELTEAINEMEKYDIDVNEVYKEFGNFTSQIIKYALGSTDEIDTKQVKKAAHKAAEKYEAKTGEKINLDEMDEDIDNAVKEIKQEMKQQRRENRDAYEIISVVFNNKTYFGILIGFIVCGVLIVLINKSVVPLCVSTIVTSVLCIIVNGVLFIATKVVPNDGDMVLDIAIKNLSGILMVATCVFFIILVASIIATVVLKKQRKVITT